MPTTISASSNSASSTPRTKPEWAVSKRDKVVKNEGGMRGRVDLLGRV
jgi:hypothetical protein